MEEEGKWEQGSPSHDRVCSFCGATQTPMWRRGPGGKTVLCNACGVKFAIRRRSSGAASAAEIGSNSADEEQEIDIPSTTGKRGRFSHSGRTSTADLSKERYYCKYCNMSWDVNYFRNRQQWGAHCSNCSRKRKLKGATLVHEFFDGVKKTNSRSHPLAFHHIFFVCDHLFHTISASFYQVLRRSCARTHLVYFSLLFPSRAGIRNQHKGPCGNSTRRRAVCRPLIVCTWFRVRSCAGMCLGCDVEFPFSFCGSFFPLAT
jgi:hypothetical protein